MRRITGEKSLKSRETSKEERRIKQKEKKKKEDREKASANSRKKEVRCVIRAVCQMWRREREKEAEPSNEPAKV